MKIRPLVQQASALIAVGTLLQTPDALAETSPGDSTALLPWTLRAGTEFGQDSSRGSEASVDYATPLQANRSFGPWFGLSGLHTDAPAQSGSTVTSSGRAYLEYGTGSLHAGVAFDSTSDQDLRHSNRWTGLLDMASGGWTGNLSIASRDTRFDSFDVSVASAARLGDRLPQEATASCTLHDMGYGASVSYGINDWALGVSGSWNDFDTTHCTFDIPVTGSLQRLDRGTFQRLAGSFLSPAVARAGGEIGTDTSLLQSSATLTLTRQWNKGSVTLAYQRAQNEFGGGIQNQYALTGTLAVATHFGIELVAGTTTSDVGDVPFVGFYLTAAL